MVPLYSGEDLPMAAAAEEQHCVELLTYLLATGGFHYSPTLDLTNALQRQATGAPIDERFVWNAKWSASSRAA